MTTLLDQAPEVLHDVLYHVDPSDLAAVSLTCRYLNAFVNRDILLWRQQYLAYYDTPTPDKDEPPWPDLLKRNTELQKVLQSSDNDIKTDEELQRVGDLIDSLMLDSTSSPELNTAWLRTLFMDNESNISSFLCRSSLFRGARRMTDVPASTPALQQLSAKLQVFFGQDIEPKCSRHTSNAEVQQVHPYARSRVYDLRRYKRANHWGPFTDDGTSSTDWEKVQAIMLDLSYNVRMYAERGDLDFNFHNTRAARLAARRRRKNVRRIFSGASSAIWKQPFYGLAPNSFVSQRLHGPIRTPPSAELDARDPYGVSGTWMRVVCFLDYSDLYNFNFDSARPASDDIERPPIDTREAFRLIQLKLHVTSIDEPEDDDHKDWPVVTFMGTSQSVTNEWDPNANSRIRGTVRTTPSGAIRWTTFSIFHGEERWRSEGVQIGGIRSARGILGNWFDKDYDAAGPAGPTCFWKVSDDVVEEPKRHGPHQHPGLAAHLGAVGFEDEASGSEDEEWEDADEGESEDAEMHDDGEDAPGLGGGALTIAELMALANRGGGVGVGDGDYDAGGSGEEGAGTETRELVIPFHQLIQLLNQAANGSGAAGGGAGGGQYTLRLEDIREFLE